MKETLLLLLILAALVGGAFYLSRFLMKRAVRTVVAAFRAKKATDRKSAVTLEQVGFVQTHFMERMFRMRDYRPYALRMLVEANIVRMTDENKVYLSEDELERSKVKTFARIKSSGSQKSDSQKSDS